MVSEKRSNNKISCFDKILNLVNYKERCSQELFTRLVIKGDYSQNEFQRAIKKAKKLHIVDDLRYAEFYIRDKTASYHGIYGILKHLEKMNIDFKQSDDLFELILDSIDSDFDRAYTYIKSHIPKSNNIYNSVIRKLIHRGFGYDVATRCAAIIMEKQ